MISIIFLSLLVKIGASFKQFSVFPKSHFLNGVFRPVDSETTLELCHNNSLFNEIDGVFCQIGSNPRHIGTNDAGYHWFDGDGMIHSAFFERNSIHYTNHWIQTKRLLAEKKWGQKMYLYFGELHGFHGMMQILKWTMYQYFALVPGAKGTANTAFMKWNNRIFALHEGDMPYEISIDLHNHTIRTVNQWTHSKLKTVTAHPKIDNERKRIYLYGYNNYDFLEGIFFYNEFDEKLNLIRQANHSLINNGMIHDIAQTKDHFIIPDMPLKYDLNQIMRDKLPLRFDKNGTTRFGILSKSNPDKIDWYLLEENNIFIFHFSKAKETFGGFQCYACTMDDLDMMDFVHLENKEFKIRGNLRLRNLIFDRKTKKVRIQSNRFIENLSDYGAPLEYNLDFPIVNPYKKDTYIYCSIFDAKNGRIVGIMKADTFHFARRKPKIFMLKNRYMNSEPQFVHIKDKDYLISFTYGQNETEDTCISLMDTENGNMEHVSIPIRIPPGFHSMYL